MKGAQMRALLRYGMEAEKTPIELRTELALLYAFGEPDE
jgi:hypothetical protein